MNRNRTPNNKKNLFTISLILALVLVLFSIFLTFNLINSASKPSKHFSDFQQDIIAAVEAGPDAFPKIKEIHFELNTGLLNVEKLTMVNGAIVVERYSVTAASSLLNSLLEQTLPNKPNLTYFQAAFLPGGAALYSEFKYGFNFAPPSWSESFRNNFSSTLSILISLLFLYLFYRMLSRNTTSIFSPTRTSHYHKIKSKIKFSDVAGNDEVKEEVKELIDYLKNPKRYSLAGARIPKGILLGGPPGTGKTLIAKAVAGEAEVPFYFMSASSFVEMIVGVGAKRVRELFKMARSDSPSILFIDELDAVGRSRSDLSFGGGDSEREQTLNQLLVEMDGMIENSGVLVIGATNRYDVLDPALLRPGRFDRLVKITLPDVKEREAILNLHARGKRFSESVEFSRIAKRTPGFSGAQLENVINEASLLSVREKSKKINMEQIDEAIDRVVGGPAKKSRTISESENIKTAYHEAGHAVVALKTAAANKVQKITIVPRGNAGGYNVMVPEEERYFLTKSQIFATIAAYMGGRAAEEIIFGKSEITSGCADDFKQATNLARKMIAVFGMSEKIGPVFLGEENNQSFIRSTNFSLETAALVDQEIKRILEEALGHAQKVINENKALLELIKNTLVEKETILAEEIEEINRTLKPLAKPEKVSEKSSKEDLTSILEEVVKE